MRDLRKDVEAIEKEVKDEDEEGKKALEETKKMISRFEEIEKKARALGKVAKKNRDDKWRAASEVLIDATTDFFLEIQSMQALGAEPDADPFGGEGDGRVSGARLRARLGAVLVDEAYDPPELPNQVGGGFGGAVRGAPTNGFPVTPATPVDPGAPQPARLPPAPAPPATTVPAAANGDAGADPFGGDDGVALGGASLKARAPAQGQVGAITLAKWDPETPYLAALKKAEEDADREGIYFEWKEKQKQGSAFYLDVADFFMEQDEPKIALRILTNVAEMNLESVPLLRILGHRLDQLGELELAEMVFREVKELRSDEPQSWRDLALVLEKRGKFQEALDTLWAVVINEWDGRFPGIQMIVLNELNRLVGEKGESLDLSAIDERFLYKLDADVRIILTWDADNTDMDLWVTDPMGERCDYSHNRTLTGGRMSEDFTGGYGPEEFMIRRALKGNYRIETEFYGNQQQVLAGATTIQAVLITNWGRANEKREAVTLRLSDEKDVVEIGTLLFKGSEPPN